MQKQKYSDTENKTTFFFFLNEFFFTSEFLWNREKTKASFGMFIFFYLTIIT